MKNGNTWPKSLANFVPWGDVIMDDVVVPDPAYAVAPAIKSDASFVDRTVSDLRKAFVEYKHAPSEPMWIAIKDIVSTIDDMATGKAQPFFYVSSLDPGVGKTQTVVHAVRNLPSDVGVLICLARIDEVNSLVKDMGLSDADFTVLVADSNEFRINSHGNPDRNEARVFFTTQGMIDSRVDSDRKFQDVSDFYFRGKPRAVRIWDESLLPGKEIKLNIHEIADCQGAAARKKLIELARLLSDVNVSIKTAADGSIYAMPDLSKFNKDIRSMRLDEPELRENLASLEKLSGRRVRVRRDRFGDTALDYTETLPDDFTPLLIIDASARIRETYSMWSRSRGNLLQLREAYKSYRDLTIHHWDQGGGEWAFAENTKLLQLVDGIVATINTKPDDEWLVIVHKSAFERISDLVHSLVKKRTGKLYFRNWGNHTATNEFRGVRNVILAGTQFFKKADYEVRARAALGLKTDDELNPDDLSEVTKGEYAHLILQALCRGSVRKCVGDSCAPMDAYIIADSNKISSSLLRKIFLGCNVVPWTPIEKPLTGKIKDTLDYLEAKWTEEPTAKIAFTEVMEFTGINDKSNFNKTVRQNEQFRAALKGMGGYERADSGKKKFPSHFARIEGEQNPWTLDSSTEEEATCGASEGKAHDKKR